MPNDDAVGKGGWGGENVSKSDDVILVRSLSNRKVNKGEKEAPQRIPLRCAFLGHDDMFAEEERTVLSIACVLHLLFFRLIFRYFS